MQIRPSRGSSSDSSLSSWCCQCAACGDNLPRAPTPPDWAGQRWLGRGGPGWRRDWRRRRGRRRRWAGRTRGRRRAGTGGVTGSGGGGVGGGSGGGGGRGGTGGAAGDGAAAGRGTGGTGGTGTGGTGTGGRGYGRRRRSGRRERAVPARAALRHRRGAGCQTALDCSNGKLCDGATHTCVDRPTDSACRSGYGPRHVSWPAPASAATATSSATAAMASSASTTLHHLPTDMACMAAYGAEPLRLRRLCRGRVPDGGRLPGRQREICDANFTCTTCATDTQCQSGYGANHLCVNGRCVAGNCRQTSDCGGGRICDTATLTCVACPTTPPVGQLSRSAALPQRQLRGGELPRRRRLLTRYGLRRRHAPLRRLQHRPELHGRLTARGSFASEAPASSASVAPRPTA